MRRVLADGNIQAACLASRLPVCSVGIEERRQEALLQICRQVGMDACDERTSERSAADAVVKLIEFASRSNGQSGQNLDIEVYGGTRNSVQQQNATRLLADYSAAWLEPKESTGRKEKRKTSLTHTGLLMEGVSVKLVPKMGPWLLHSRVFGLGPYKDGNIGVRVFPER